MRAQYYDAETREDQIYYETFTFSPQVLEKGNYILTLNNEPEMASTGMRNTFYSEIRWWNNYRSIEDIKINRYQ